MRQTCARKVVAEALLCEPKKSEPPPLMALARAPPRSPPVRIGRARVTDADQCSSRSVPANQDHTPLKSAAQITQREDFIVPRLERKAHHP